MFDIDIASAHENLYDHFEYFNQPDSAFRYLALAYSERSILTKRKLANLAAFQQTLLNRERVSSNLEKENLAIQNRYRTYFFLIILVVFIVIGAILLRGYRQKQKANLLLAEQKDEIQAALNRLKATQAQLIQSEKLASLGQLTAGIAHEIKNPLNFVNNFSEVNVELLDEIAEERSKKPEARDETLISEILQDVKDNMKKVLEHGSRANGIVTSMLQHSKGGTGKKEPTELNALIKEYVNLSFHGMRAGKNPVNVDIALDLDPAINEVSLIKEDFARVVIKLCNNACDAMRMKSLQGFQTLEGIGAYHPKLTVRTKTQKSPLGDLSLEISIDNNGPGIPDEIREKILQPFFTTKKGTDGTGLAQYYQRYCESAWRGIDGGE
jgi:signal transduction histidine kinase